MTIITGACYSNLLGQSKPKKIIIASYIVCLLGASSTHLYDMLTQGSFAPYNVLLNAPLSSNIFWSSLIYLDLLVVASLFLNPKLGSVLCLALMLLDVAHNSFACYTFLNSTIGDFPGLQMQIAFLVYVLGSIRFILK